MHESSRKPVARSPRRRRPSGGLLGDVKKFVHIDLLVNIIAHWVPVEVGGVGDLDAALVYGNHSSIGPYEENITSKIADDVRLGRALVFPREAADRIPGLHMSPLGVTLSPS